MNATPRTRAAEITEAAVMFDLHLTEWEVGFLESCSKRETLTEKQERILAKLEAKAASVVPQ
jgi:hypothetical protein